MSLSYCRSADDVYECRDFLASINADHTKASVCVCCVGGGVGRGEREERGIKREGGWDFSLFRSEKEGRNRGSHGWHQAVSLALEGRLVPLMSQQLTIADLFRCRVILSFVVVRHMLPAAGHCQVRDAPVAVQLPHPGGCRRRHYHQPRQPGPGRGAWVWGGRGCKL